MQRDNHFHHAWRIKVKRIKTNFLVKGKPLQHQFAIHSFLKDNLGLLLKRWMGPVSIAIFAPGRDYLVTVKDILHSRDCSEERFLVKTFVTFHLFFPIEHLPERIIPEAKLGKYRVNCRQDERSEIVLSYKHENRLVILNFKGVPNVECR